MNLSYIPLTGKPSNISKAAHFGGFFNGWNL